MSTHFDAAFLALYAFWFFFAALIYYLQRESNREGVPLESETSQYVRSTGVSGLPTPKTFILPHGAGTVTLPNDSRDTRAIAARAVEPWPGSPLVPTGNPMLDSVGPGSYAERANVPDLTIDGTARVVPMRVATDYHVELTNMDPRGMPVLGADGVVAGKVSDIWVDRSEAMIRYLEVEVGQRKVLLPITFAEIKRTQDAGAMPGLEWFFSIIMPGPKRAANDGRVIVDAVLAKHFTDVPATASSDHITRREEDRVCAYYGGGLLYATKERAEPLI
jgi:photosynthetic reaction center H subunit